MYKFFIGSVVALWFLAHSVQAHGLRLSAVEVLDDDELELELRWAHAWRLDAQTQPGNHDAAWCFVKYRERGGGWQHLDMPLQASAYANRSQDAVEVLPARDGAGFWIRAAAIDSLDSLQAKIHIDLAQPLPDTSRLQLQAFAIEMVYIPEGAFYAGDGRSFFHLQEGSTGAPFHVQNAGAITSGPGPGQLYSDSDFVPASLPARYPKGYRDFYVMKYEITQQQYADFLNTLTLAQQSRRIQVAPTSSAGTALFPGAQRHRNGLVIRNPAQAGQPARVGVDANQDGRYGDGADGRHRAMSYLSWSDLTAYLDWAALRPMTELEFEKACRGPAGVVAREMAFGSAQVVDANRVIANGTPSEGVEADLPAGHGLASHGYAGPQGPLRTGFAGRDTTGRLASGGSYFGVMEMSGNVWELVVNLSGDGVSYDGRHGDGQLSAQGDADVAAWPQARGAGHRGGAWSSGVVGGFRDIAVSDRYYIYLPPTQRRNTTGGRGVRKSPLAQLQTDTLTWQRSSQAPFRGGPGSGYGSSRWRGSQAVGGPEADDTAPAYAPYFHPASRAIIFPAQGAAPSGTLSYYSTTGQLMARQRLQQSRRRYVLPRLLRPAATYLVVWQTEDGHRRRILLPLYSN